jgi:hypothetical protein
MRFVLITVVVGALVLGGIALSLIRTVPHTPIERWHVDPLTAPVPATPNFFRVAPVDRVAVPPDQPAATYRADAATLAKAFDDFAARQRDTIRIAGTPAEGWMTYVQRTEVLKFPDYLSVRFIDLGGGRSTLAIFSRSRYGHGDMGVNRARVQAWLEALKPFEE